MLSYGTVKLLNWVKKISGGLIGHLRETKLRSIVEALKHGTGKERLAVISDVATIVGISFASALGGAFALSSKLDVENIIGSLIVGLLSLAGASLVVLIFATASSWLTRRFAQNLLARQLLQLSLWLVFLALFLFAAYFAFVILSSVRFVKA